MGLLLDALGRTVDSSMTIGGFNIFFKKYVLLLIYF